MVKVKFVVKGRRVSVCCEVKKGALFKFLTVWFSMYMTVYKSRKYFLVIGSACMNLTVWYEI